eukprot:gene4044-biopygen5579
MHMSICRSVRPGGGARKRAAVRRGSVTDTGGHRREVGSEAEEAWFAAVLQPSWSWNHGVRISRQHSWSWITT